MLEGYCADIEHLLREGALREPVRLAVALPDICAALESPRMRSSHEDYSRWCESWLKFNDHGPKRVTGARVYRLHALHSPPTEVRAIADPFPPPLVKLRMRRHARADRSLGRPRVWQPHTGLETFQVSLCEALLVAARDWYREHGRADPIVQANLGKLVVG